MAITRLGTLAGLKKLIGEANIDEYTTPYVGDEADEYLEQFLDLASEEVAGRLPQHNVSTLVNSVLLNRAVTAIAAWHLTNERGNPPHFLQLVEWAWGFLSQVKSGEIALLQTTRSNSGPGIVNYEHQPSNYRFPVVVDVWATSPQNWPSDLFHGVYYGPLAPYFW